ncbi:MAG TPA: beta-ketoacyl synthase N-terminal-like domain-containing protein [Bacilli bacterium]
MSETISLRRVAITGMGIVSAIGRNIAEFAHSLRTGKSGIGYLPPFGPGEAGWVGAPLGEFAFADMLKNNAAIPEPLKNAAMKSGRRAPLSIQCAIISAMEAWLQAGLHMAAVQPERIGIIIAGNNLTQAVQFGLYPKFHDTPEYLPPSYGLQFMDTDHLGTLSEVFAVRGEGFTAGGASASGNVGLIKGLQLIRHGMVDVCMVIGAMADLSPMELQGFANMGALGGKRFYDRPQEACRPFDQDHEGFIYGKASGCVILEAAGHATARGATVLAELAGGAIALDGNRLADPNMEGEIRAMQAALKQAGMSAEEIDYINAHGTSTPLGDETEINALRQVFRPSLSRVRINSTKELTGHCLYAAGVVEAIATVMQMREGFIHPNPNLKNPIAADMLFGESVAVPAAIRAALSNSFGFGGINTAIIIRKG